ncbi:1-phosphofructokinase [Thermohalobacter berrensis]|uniref:Tagatose-6-phosphate kinase n=1 Tax=Thermohalobacter berrensis TaxID=99594 RepID=A0A419SXX4_9FIRM|nr:1-phosphofructokinase [Thermohalobacter berrensis]RKD30031.1 1-phosphofructokinase [Thermohalobacter berrensis]
MITTITLNPAIDKTITTNEFNIGSVNRVTSTRVDAAGKGINVSKVIKALGGESKAIGIFAGNSGEFIKQELDKLGIQNDFIMVNGETRTNIKVVDIKNQVTTEINEKGPFIEDKDLRRIKEKIVDIIPEDSVAVFSGSVPQNVDIDIYKFLIEKAKEKGVKCILDTSKKLLSEGIKAGPYLVKPNIHELEELFGKRLDSYKKVVDVTKDIFKYGIEYIVVSLGKDGSLFITKDKAALVEGMKVDVKSTVGAGDSMVAALALAIDKNYPFEGIIKLASATSTASVMTEGTQPGSIETIRSLENKVKFKYI